MPRKPAWLLFLFALGFGLLALAACNSPAPDAGDLALTPTTQPSNLLASSQLPAPPEVTAMPTQAAPTLAPEPQLPAAEQCLGNCLLINLPIGGSTQLSLLDPQTGELALLPIPSGYYVPNLAAALAPGKVLLTSNTADQPGFALFDLKQEVITNKIEQTPPGSQDYQALFAALSSQISADLIRKGLGPWALEGGMRESLRRAWLAPDGETVYFTDAGLDGYTHLHHFSASSGLADALEDEALYVENLVTSPSGSWLLLRKGVNPAFSSPTLTRFYLLDAKLQLRPLTLPVIPANAYWSVRWDANERLLFEAYDTVRLQYTRLLRYDPAEDAFETLWEQPYHAWMALGERQAFTYLGQDKTALTLTTGVPNPQVFYVNSQCHQLLPGDGEADLYLGCQNPDKPWMALISGALLPSAGPRLESQDQGPQGWTLRERREGDESLITLENGAQNKKFELQTTNLRQTFWEPEGKYLVFLSQTGLWLVDLASGELAQSSVDLGLDYPKLEAFWVSFPQP